MEYQYEADGELEEMGLHPNHLPTQQSQKDDRGYTKGEWVREEVNDQLICLKELRNEAYYYIAEIWQGDDMEDAEFEANAQLIASAPDLYEACKIALGILVAYDSKSSREIADIVRQALAKAGR